MRVEIKGTPMPVAIVHLDQNESIKTEKGAMSWMTSNLDMETSGGGLGKMVSRAFSGESMFQNIYTARNGSGMIAMASSFPGEIREFNVSDGDIIAQKRSFLAATAGVDLSIFFQKKASSGFFGGEGFIMQKLSGQGLVFLEFDGYIKQYDLAPGQQIVVDTGYLAAMDPTCSIEIKTVPGIKNMLFGGEGLFNTVVTGPGRVWLQTMPVPQLAGAVQPYIVTSN